MRQDHPYLKGGRKCPGTFSTSFLYMLVPFSPPPPPLVHIFVIFNEFHRFWTKMLQLVAPAGDPRLRITRKLHFLRNIQKLLSAAGQTHDKNQTF